MSCVFLTTAELFRTGMGLRCDSVRAQYVYALELLRNNFSRYHAGENVDVNNMAASILLLTVFESITGEKVMAWSTHMAGFASLLSQMNPAVLGNLKSTFGALVLLAALGGCVAEALLNNHACFLDQDTWQNVLVDAHVEVVASMPYLEPTQKFVSVWCQIPGLLAAACDLITSAAAGALTDSPQVLNRAVSLHDQLRSLTPLVPDRLESWTKTDGMWYVFNENEQDVGNFCNFQVALAILCRIIVSLQTGILKYEVEAYKLAQTVVYMHEAILDCDKSRSRSADIHEQGPTVRIMQLRHAFAVIDTHETFLQHCLRPTAQDPNANVIHHSDFLEFHDRIRGISFI